MKKILITLSLVFTLLIGSTVAAYAGTGILNGREAIGPYYSKYGTAYLQDTSRAGYMLLSVSSSPSATTELLDSLGWFCSAVDYLHLSDVIPGCDYVDFADKIYKYVDKGMKVQIELRDAGTNDYIGSYVMSDGSVIYLGNDHPNGYIVLIKNYMNNYPWVQLTCLDNIKWE